jgi:hypothetical protein
MSVETYEDRDRGLGTSRHRRHDGADTRMGALTAPSLGLPLAGLAAVGLAALAWYYLGPDLRRYVKLRNM